MKNKLINFIAAMGIPVSGITTQGAGCTGVCGSCSLNCAPGIVALLLLAGKVFYKRYHSGGGSMNKKMLKRVLAFVLMAAVMVGLVFFRSENNYDKHYFRAKLARGQEVHCRIDLGKEGELKYLLQPNIYTLYLRLLPEDKQAQLRCEGEGLQLLLSRSSKKGLWRKLAPDEMMKQYKGQMSVSAELYFSPEQLKQRHVQQGKIKFYDAKGLYGTVVIDVINSRVKRD